MANDVCASCSFIFADAEFSCIVLIYVLILYNWANEKETVNCLSVRRYCVCVWLTVVTGGKVFILDLAAKIDQCAEYICKQQWGDLEFPPPFGREAFAEVAYFVSYSA